MDPSIMKLLEDDEDESMHSGADVDALSAALNRDIGGDASTFSQSSEPDLVGVLPQGNSSASKQLLEQWQTSSQDGNIGQQSQPKEDQMHLESSDKHSSQTEPVQQESGAKDQDQQDGGQPEGDQLPVQQEQPRSDQQLQTETNASQNGEKAQGKISEQIPIQLPKQERAQQSESQQQLSFQQMNIPQTPAANDPRRMKSQPSIPFHLLIPIIRPHLDKDRSMQLQAVFTKLRTNEVSKEDFLRVIRNIVGDQMLRQAVNKVHIQLQAQAARNPQSNPNQYSLQNQVSSQQLPSRGSQQLAEPHSFLHHPMSSSHNQKGQRSPPRQPHVPVSTVQMQMDASFPPFENGNQKSRETESKVDGKGMHASPIYSSNMNVINPERESSIMSLQSVNKQQQHAQLPQSHFTMYGNPSGSFHSQAYPRPSIGAAAMSLKSQSQDSQTRQAQHTQGMVSTHLGATQAMNMLNAPKYDVQTSNNETKRLHGGPLTSHGTLQQNPGPWQPMANKDQRSAAFPSMAHVKKEVVDQSESQQPSQLTALEGSSFSAARTDQVHHMPGAVKDEGRDKQSSRTGFSSSISAMGGHISGHMATQVDPTMQMHSQISSATPPLLTGTTTRTPPKKSSVGQKKPSEALGSSPPPSSKKQKTTGAFHDQSIEQLNDVTAVSGVNLREEEEQLLSAPKEESRASEAARRVVQEEEERLILQKGPLQRKLADILSQCGIKSISSDVERCLSLCVEERLRGLISYLIRLSKQRVDMEKTRHHFVITSDVRRQILAMNRKAKEEWDKKQAEEAEKFRKLSDTEGNTGPDADKDKDEGRSKATKVNKEEDDKMRTTAANVAARAAVGGDDMLSKWQLMAEQARQKREGIDGPSSSQPGKTTSHKPSPSFKRSSKEQQETERRGSSSSVSGGIRKLGKSSQTMSHPKVVRNISTKDVIAVLEREPQMSKSTLLYRLYERVAGDSMAE